MDLGTIELALILPGPALVVWGSWHLFTELRPLRWKRVGATVTKSEVVWNDINMAQTICTPSIEYEYQLNETVMKGSADFFSLGNYDSAADIVKKFPEGRSITILMNPINPKESCFRFQLTPKSWAFILVGIIFTAFAIFNIRSLR